MQSDYRIILDGPICFLDRRLTRRRMSIKKTNAIRLLEEAGLSFELRQYEVDQADLSAISVAQKLGLEAAQTFKTLVARGEQVVVACIPGDASLDLKALASLSQQKRLELVAVKDIQGVTGYIRGGVSPLGLKKAYPLFLDELAFVYDQISISAGVRGLQILLAPLDLQALLNMQVGDLSVY